MEGIHKLPKDMLVKLITTVQDPGRMSDSYLLDHIIDMEKEMNKRKTRKIKEYLLNLTNENGNKEKYKEYVDVIKDISYIRLSYGKCLVYVIIFFGDKDRESGNYSKISSFLYSDIMPMGSLYTLRINEKTIISESSTGIERGIDEENVIPVQNIEKKDIPYRDFVKLLGNDSKLISEISEYMYHRSESTYFD